MSDDTHALVREAYTDVTGGLVNRGSWSPPDRPVGAEAPVATSWCAPDRPAADATAVTMATLMGYTEAEAASAGNLGLGCGTPIPEARLREGETVVDLGSGAGMDCFVAAQKVGSTGHIIGVDMTPAMLDKARKNNTYPQVEFRLGEIEHLPVADCIVDCVVSNCVINLSPDKLQVFREVLRVLKPGGRLCISDVVAHAEIPAHLQTAEAYACWVAGAPKAETVPEMLKEAGFTGVALEPHEHSRELIAKWMPGSGAEDVVTAATIRATKPAQQCWG